MKTVEILSAPACAACVRTKNEMTANGIQFTEVRATRDAEAAADLTDRYTKANGGIMDKTAPLVLISNKDGEVLDYWAGTTPTLTERVINAIS